MSNLSDFTGAPPDWTEITNKPAEATRWPTFTEVTSKPATYPPSAHNQDASTITSGTFSEYRIPTSSSSTKGGVRVWRSGTTGYIYTSN